VDPDDAPGPSHLSGGDEGAEARTRADVHHALSRIEAAERERVAYAGERLDPSIGQRVDRGRVVAESSGERPPGVKVEHGPGLHRHLAVLLADLFAELVSIDEGRLIHRSTSVPDRHRQGGSPALREPVLEA